MWGLPLFLLFFFFNDTATTEIYTLSLHDALPIFASPTDFICVVRRKSAVGNFRLTTRSEEHTSELQSRLHLVCRLLLEKKKIDLTTHRRNSHTQTSDRLLLYANNAITVRAFPWFS